ncbi:DUF1840 domain-containing protein [Nitrosovibrio sp. Nv17]|uniref:DUF1840 domain-containing protein n=1 Tax=Nitrosovibrio sp. Nv17 TaxID=1855339 RepID=UPI000908D964|nr:DUF1840 domain-containing protein [Nitrosovibrio sp. Nv17]SFW16275.1 protein of unknown function [Nitrosovibrio sp. Nv17]
MLVTFSSDTHANIIMFGDVAQRLLRMMGHSGVVPGAILAADVPAALARLQGALEKEPSGDAGQASTAGAGGGGKETEEVQPVSIVHRALPLIDLLAEAARKQRDVMWK